MSEGNVRKKGIPFSKIIDLTSTAFSYQINDYHHFWRLVFSAAYFSSHYGVADFQFADNTNVYIIAGTKDRLISCRSTEKLAHSLHTKPVFLQDTGHLHNYEKPHETAEEILKILADSSSAE